ncbi:xylulokinase [Aggregatibacter actinomycetemcomitans]|uniref:xylulokinase n=2 Tax=Aggregatibacter actinomycetemcomitans TaxID=714 RepID=UPI0011E0A503|nr:xylulokinase [Aggregatibacter actinomycetemcomitans]QEH46892.1 xylulokinase [Aggregatibacter actinomycetemcomitans]
MYLGVDCGTQGTKVIVVDSQQHKVLGSGYAAHQLIENSDGRREQTPDWWITAFKNAFADAVKHAEIQPHLIRGIGISGQQHGLVVLDKNDRPLYHAKLWCDTETAAENAEILALLGGEQACFERLGIVCQTGYTASKIRWLRKYQPDIYQQIDKIMLPHDYLNYWFTGKFCTEYGDASGTGYFDVVRRCWDEEVLRLIAPGKCPENLPHLIDADQILGTVKADVARQLGLADDVIVSAGGGDNMMGAIGTGNIRQGIVTMSLGTSGTLYAYSDKPLPDLPPMIADFCSSSGGWLPLVCTMNVTSANKNLMQLLEINVSEFNELVQQANIGADGVTILPFFNGERVPALPNSKAVILGLDAGNFTRANLSRAVMESASFTLRYGLDLFEQAGLAATEIRLIGGGAKSAVWRQMIADIMNVNVVCLMEEEAAALDAAIQAMWVNKHGSLAELCRAFVQLNEGTRTAPIAENAEQYQSVYQRYRQYLNAQYSV